MQPFDSLSDRTRQPESSASGVPYFRWLFAGFASALLGGLLTWGTLVDGGIVLLFELTSGAIGLLTFLHPNYRSHSVFVMVMVIVTAVIYGIIGALVTAARDHRPAFASALLAVGLFAVGVMVEFAVREMHHPGRLMDIPREIEQVSGNRDVRFILCLAGLSTWHAFVVSSLLRAYSRSRDGQRVVLDDHVPTDAS